MFILSLQLKTHSLLHLILIGRRRTACTPKSSELYLFSGFNLLCPSCCCPFFIYIFLLPGKAHTLLSSTALQQLQNYIHSFYKKRFSLIVPHQISHKEILPFDTTSDTYFKTMPHTLLQSN